MGERMKHFHAIVADEVYKNPNERQTRIFGYDIMNDVNTKHEVAYKNDTAKHILVGFRGTFDAGDISSDRAIIRGRERSHPRFTHSRNVVLQLKRNYPDYKVTLGGHSLGARIADVVSRDLDLRAFTFNRGAGLASLWEHPNPRAIEYRTKPDLVSFLNRTHSYIQDTKYKDPIRAHSSTNFLPNSAIM